MDYAVYCDESRQDKNGAHRYMAIGSLWVPKTSRYAASKQLRVLLEKHGVRAEMKWHRTSSQSLPGYLAAVDHFFSIPELCYRVIVIDQSELDLDKYHDGDWERAFYVFYYELLAPWMTPEDTYSVLLDRIASHHQSRIELLNSILVTKLGAAASIVRVHAVDSAETPLIQLADLLTGAAAASWCDDVRPDSPKAILIARIAEHLEQANLRFRSGPGRCKFNTFAIRLRS